MPSSIPQSSFNNDNSINADYNDEDDDDAVSSSSSLTDEMSLMQYEEDSDENNSAPVSVIGGKRPLKHANNSSNGNNPSSKSVKSLMWSSRFGGKSTTMQHSDDMNRNGSPSTSLSSYCICNGKYDSSEYMVSCFECQGKEEARFAECLPNERAL